MDILVAALRDVPSLQMKPPWTRTRIHAEVAPRSSLSRADLGDWRFCGRLFSDCGGELSAAGAWIRGTTVGSEPGLDNPEHRQARPAGSSTAD
jgi:hypothetical protein